MLRRILPRGRRREKKKIAIALSRLGRRLSLFSHLFIADVHIPTSGCRRTPPAIFHATIRSYCRDYWTFSSATADLNQRVFQRASFVRVRACAVSRAPFVQRRVTPGNIVRDIVAQLRTSPFHISCISPTRNTVRRLITGLLRHWYFVTFIVV